MSSHSSNTTVGSRPPSPQRDTPSGPTSRPADAPYASLSSGRIPQHGGEQGNGHGHATIIDIFPDEIFLQVFEYCSTDENPYNWWHALVHVCRRWRQLIFISPRRLDLQLLCTRKTPVRNNLSLWPTIPITIYEKSRFNPTEEDNLFAALEYPNRIRNVTLQLSRSQFEKVAMAMQVPFPALSHLQMSSFRMDSWLDHGAESTLPDGLLGGNASSLRDINLNRISFPALSALLLSADNLISLRLVLLFDLPVPGTLATSLAATTRLEDLFIEARCRAFPPNNRYEAPPTRAVLPALTRFQFGGGYTYFEDLVAKIDCPRLRFMDTLYDEEDLESSQLFDFIGRSEVFKLAPFRRARVDFGQMSIDLDGSRAEPHPSHLQLRFQSRRHFPVRTTAEFLLPASAILTTVHHLALYRYDDPLGGRHIPDWIEFFRLFPAVETLQVAKNFVKTIGPVLNELTLAGLLPALRFLHLDGPPTKSVLQFISARQVSGCSVTLVKKREFKLHVACCETKSVVDKHSV